MAKTVDARLDEISLQLEAHARVQGLILLLLAGYAFQRDVILEVAGACGVSPMPEPEQLGH
jgi:hypothetical protein